ncbi:MAG: EFR1 family ferrodoxin [Fusobacteriaceae bacterium]
MNKIYYFTGTGNSYHVAKKMAQELEMELINIPEIIEDEMLEFEGDTFGIIFPVYAMGIPQMVGKFLTKLKIKGNPYIFAIATCGGSGYGIPFSLIDSVLKDKREKGEQSLKLDYSSYLQVPDNYLKLFKMKSEKDAIVMVDLADDRLSSKIQEIREKKRNSYIKFLINPIFKMIYMLWLGNIKRADRKFRVEKSCISCNLCRDICPSRNIEMREGKPFWNGKCQDCMGCIHICPVSAIQYGKKSLKSGRYLNPYVTREELKIKRNKK